MSGPGADDILRLVTLAAAASSAATATAYAVDAVVKEALLFFATVSPLSGRNFAEASAADSQEAFRAFGQRADANARAAGDACAMAHQLAAHGGMGAEIGRGDGKVAGPHSNTISIVLAAGHVGIHTDRIAATAREAAQLCMGILENAVQANASRLARETAKRCAEQALHSIEVASMAEHHNRSLDDLLARLMPSIEQQQAGQPVPPTGLSTMGTEGHGIVRVSRPQQGDASRLLEVPTRSSSRRWWEVDTPRAQTAAAAAQAANRGFYQRGQLVGMSCSSEMAVASPAPILGIPQRLLLQLPPEQQQRHQQQPQPQLAGNAIEDIVHVAEQVEQYLSERSQLCISAIDAVVARGIGGETVADAANAEDRIAIRTLVEWRYGLALTIGCAEEEFLSDIEVVCLATWRCSGRSDEEPISLPEDLLQAACRAGAEHFTGLVSALRRATQQAPQELRVQQPPTSACIAERSVVPTTFVTSSPQWFPETGGSCSDWDVALDRLCWRAPLKSGGVGSFAADRPVAGIFEWQASSLPWVPSMATAACEDPLSSDDWCIDDLSSRQLYLLSMHSRARQRRCTRGQRKCGTWGGSFAAQEDSRVGGGEGQTPAMANENDEAEVSELLAEVFAATA